MSDFENLFTAIEVPFSVYTDNAGLFKEAFTHRSVTHEGGAQTDNERLEFLGDAVLELVTTEWLFKNFPEHQEGLLTNYRSALVKRENLAVVARKLQLGDYLRMSRGEARSGGREKDYLLANVVEAFIGALYLSGSMKLAKDFVENYVVTELEEILEQGNHIDAKSELQELTQGGLALTPRYEVLSEQGKDHEKEFEIGVYLDDKLLGMGTGKSKKEAQTAAAMQAVAQKDEWFNTTA